MTPDNIKSMEDLDGTELAEFIKTGKGGVTGIRVKPPHPVPRKASMRLLVSKRQQRIFRRSK